MYNKLIASVLCLLIFVNMAFTQDTGDVILASIKKYGGIERLNKIAYIKKHTNGHKHWIEQSEHPRGPFITSYEEVTETYALFDSLLFQNVSVKQFQSANPIVSTVILNKSKGDLIYGDKVYPMPKSYLGEILSLKDYDPLHLLLLAKQSKNRRLISSPTNKNEEYVVGFIAKNRSYTLFINGSTNLITQAHIETFLPDDNFFSAFGKFDTKVIYSLYQLYENGIRYPGQWDVYRFGVKWRSITTDKIEFMEELTEEIFIATNPIVEATSVIMQQGRFERVMEIEDKVFALPGQWLVHWVVQDDGIIILEAPISSSYSKSIIDYLKRTYPFKPIKGVIVTSDAFPHISGVREYVFHDIPIYTHPKNREILDKIIHADYSLNPDDLEKDRKKPNYKFVTKPIFLNSKETPIKIFPINGAASNKMLMVISSQTKWLYGSDLVQQFRDGTFFMPQYLSELKEAVDRNNCSVSNVSGMHTKPINWKSVEEYLVKFTE